MKRAAAILATVALGAMLATGATPTRWRAAAAAVVIAVAAMASAGCPSPRRSWAQTAVAAVSVGVILASVGVTLDAFGGLVVTMITGALGMLRVPVTPRPSPLFFVRSPSKALRKCT